MKKTIHSLLLGWITLVAAPTAALACDACNLGFTDELAGERAGSIIARDLARAMKNQQDLKMEGYSNPQLMAAQIAKMEGTDGAPAAAAESGSAETQPAVGCCGSPNCETLAATEESVETESAATAEKPVPSVPPSNPEALALTAKDFAALPRDVLEGPLSPISAGREIPAYMESAEFYDIIAEAYELPTTPYSTVPQDAPVDKKFTLIMSEGKTYIGNGVVYDGFTVNNQIPGPTLVVDQGDVVEMEFVNEGTVPHGASIHAAYTQTSKYVGKLNVGETKSVKFRAMMPGVYMYHCAPGGHAIGMHVIGGQYGMIMVKPKPGSYQLEQELGHPPDLELYLIQHELYSNGKDSISGDPQYVLFNGRTFRYVEEPIVTNPGDYVRIHFLNVGPNILSTFHIVGIIWDYVYWQGNPDVRMPGGQSVTAGPTDSFTIEFRMPPDEGAYTMLTHAVGSTNRGAIGLIVVDGEAELPPERVILADGPQFNEAEMKGYVSDATRIISPFGIGTAPVDRPVVYGPETEEVFISIIGNSFWPKVVQIAPGTKVTWTNEDVFTYLGGEYAGIHNASATSRPEGGDGFNTPLLAHGESYTHEFDQLEHEYEYICTPHPYMTGMIIVKEPEYALAEGAGGGTETRLGGWTLPLLGLALLLSSGAFVVGIGRKS